MVTSELDQVIKVYHESVTEFVRGNPEPQKPLWSHRDDVTLANPLGPAVLGREKVFQVIDRAASSFRDGAPMVFERIVSHETPELAFILEIERFRMKIGASEEIASGALRVTTIFRREEDGWKIVHRHADNINAPRSPESLGHQ